ELAALKNSSLCYCYVSETTGAFRNSRLTMVETRNESTAEAVDLSEGVRFTALVRHDDRGPLFDRQLVRLEVPIWVGSPGGCLRKQVGEGRERSKRHVVAKFRTRSGRVVERGRIAFIQSHDLGKRFRVALRHNGCHCGKGCSNSKSDQF